MRLRAILINTTKEAIRQPIYSILVACGALLIVLSFWFTFFTFGEEIKMIKDMGCATITLVGLLVALFSSSSVITDEIDKKTAITVLCKPVSRRTFLLGKFLGIVVAVIIAIVVLTVVFVGRLYIAEKRIDPVVLEGILLSFFQVLILTAASVAVSTRFPMIVNVSFCFVLFIVGHLTNWLMEMLKGANVIVRFIGKILYIVLPNLSNFDVSSVMALGVQIKPNYLIATAAYSLLYTIAVLSIANAMFHNRELM